MTLFWSGPFLKRDQNDILGEPIRPIPKGVALAGFEDKQHVVQAGTGGYSSSEHGCRQ